VKDESGKIIKFTLETPGYKHGSKSTCKHILTEEQETRIADLWFNFANQVWAITNEETQV
jgi:hypothetical protein